MYKGMHKGRYFARAMEGTNACKPLLLAGSGERIRTSDLRVMSLKAISKINALGLFWMHKDAQSSPACTKNVQRLFAFFHALFALRLIHH
jgi:hypothetical protein